MKSFISYYEFLKDAKSKNFSKNFKTENFRNFRKVKFFKKIQNFQIYQSQSPSQSSKSVTWFFYRKAEKYLRSEILGSCRNFWHCALPWCDAEYSSWSKNRLFFRKNRVFFAAGGSRCQKFLSSNYSAHVAEKTAIVAEIGNKCCICTHIHSQENCEWIYRGKKVFGRRTPFWKHDFGKKTQKCSENQFQDSSTFLREATLPFSEKHAHFAHFGGKVTFSRRHIFCRWKPPRT